MALISRLIPPPPAAKAKRRGVDMMVLQTRRRAKNDLLLASLHDKKYEDQYIIYITSSPSNEVS